MRQLAALALLPVRLSLTGVIIALDIAGVLLDLRRGDRAGKWGA